LTTFDSYFEFVLHFSFISFVHMFVSEPLHIDLKNTFACGELNGWNSMVVIGRHAHRDRVEQNQPTLQQTANDPPFAVDLG
jgi:hypothetical protein